MNNPLNSTQGGRHHPAMIVAAIAVILFCLAGTAAILGWIPSSFGGPAKHQLSDADQATLSAKMQQDGQLGAPAALATAQPPLALASQERSQDLRQSGSQPYPAQNEPRVSTYREADLAQAEPARATCTSCGRIESVRAIQTRAQGSGLGAAGGAVLGGLLGNQIGGGHGRQLATVAGAVGGAVVGNQVEGNMKATTSYEIRVRMDNGHYRSFHQNSAPRWAAGDRVRVVNGSLHSV